MGSRRTTIEIDPELLERAKKALGESTTRATVEEALRRVAEMSEGERGRTASKQLRYLEGLKRRADLAVLESSEMWR